MRTHQSRGKSTFAKTLKVMMIINVNTSACTEMSLHDLMGPLAGYPELSLWHVDDFQLKTIKAQEVPLTFLPKRIQTEDLFTEGSTMGDHRRVNWLCRQGESKAVC